MKSAKPVEIVIAGLGRAGWDIHWRQLLRDLDLFKVVGVIEPMAERRHEAEAEIGCPSFANFAEFLSRPVGELVCIATPSGGHGQEALDCLEHGLLNPPAGICGKLVTQFIVEFFNSNH